MASDLLRYPEAINGEDHIVATYYIETPMEPYKAANIIAAEQSTGTWARAVLETDEVRERHGVKVIGIFPLPYNPSSPSLPTSEMMAEYGDGSGKINAFVLRLAFPHINFGPKVPNLLTAVAGELTEIGALTAVKLMDLEFPEGFLKEFPGPKFGIEGTRRLLGVYGRPLIGSIIKPCVGIPIDTIAELAYQGAKGGLDFIKDDELLADTSYSSVKDRVKAVQAALKRAEEETGEKTMFAYNITDRLDRMRELHDIVVDNGGMAVMLNAVASGLEALRELAEFTRVPIHCHRAMAPLWTRSPHMGITTNCLTKLFRICGADQTHCGAIAGKLYEGDQEVLDNIRACTMGFGSVKSSMPVSSGGQWAGKAPVNLRKIGDPDFIHLSGGGIYGHPGGAEAGARSVREAWDATFAGISLEEYAKDHPALAQAIKHFGKPVY
jgi:ribulose-bisphosphate carboxylase large chain